MIRKRLFIAGGILFFSAAACQGKNGSLAQACWDEAEKMRDLNQYVSENAADISMETLMEEAGAAEEDLSLQFQTAALLCALEFENSPDGKEVRDKDGRVSDDAMYQADYPLSTDYAEKFLAQAKDAGKDFWNVLSEEAFYPYDCFAPLFAAAEQLDADTLAALLYEAPEDGSYRDKLLSAADLWIEKNPQHIVKTGDKLLQEGYYKDWDVRKWKQIYFSNGLKDGCIQTDSLQEAFSYVSYLRNSLLPMLKKEFGKKEFQTSGAYTGEPCYETGLTVVSKEELKLKQPDKKSISKNKNREITIDGKRAAAFYQNTQAEEWEGSPAGLRLLGDFMLGMPEEEYPSSTGQADYYLILTPEYRRGQFYKDKAGNETKVQQVYSCTSIDLYNAKNGRFLRRLGYVEEQPKNIIFEDLTAEISQYPEFVSADVLSFIYHNMNDLDSYITLLDNTAGLDELQSGEPVIIGNWEITYKSCQIVKTFDEGILRYTADDGKQYVRAEFQVTNRSAGRDTFLPNVYRIGEDVVIEISGPSEKSYGCINAINDSRCLNNTSLGTGESKEGELIFEVPDQALAETGRLSIVISRGNQRVSYRLNGAG